MIHDEMGRVLFRGFEPDWEIISNRPNYIQCLGADGEMGYEASCADVDEVGTLTYDESGYLVFRSNDPEPEVVVETTVAETVPETTVAETTAETTASTE